MLLRQPAVTGKRNEWFRNLLAQHSVKQKDLAVALGYNKPSANMITYHKAGITWVPIQRVPALAAMFGLPVAPLLFDALQDRWPEVAQTFESELHTADLTDKEWQIIRFIRANANGISIRIDETSEDDEVLALKTFARVANL